MSSVLSPAHLLLVCVVVSVVAENGERCVPDCNHVPPGQPTRDPTSCTDYYLCEEGGRPSPDVLTCPPDTTFSPDLAVCVATSRIIHCHPDPSCTPDATQAPSTPLQQCHYSCRGGSEDLTTDPFDCSAFYYCRDGDKFGPFFCPEARPYFTGRHCEAVGWHCCRPVCLAFCSGNQNLVADPLDCRTYFYCKDHGPPAPDARMQCGEGKVLGVPGHCIPGDTCTPVCDLAQADRLLDVAGDLWRVGELTAVASDRQLLVEAASQFETLRYDTGRQKKHIRRDVFGRNLFFREVGAAGVLQHHRNQNPAWSHQRTKNL